MLEPEALVSVVLLILICAPLPLTASDGSAVTLMPVPVPSKATSFKRTLPPSLPTVISLTCRKKSLLLVIFTSGAPCAVILPLVPITLPALIFTSPPDTIKSFNSTVGTVLAPSATTKLPLSSVLPMPSACNSPWIRDNSAEYASLISVPV